MSLTNKLRKLVDIPLWETLRFSPVPFNYYTTFAQNQNCNGRYIYFTYTSTYFIRYDTWTDQYTYLNAPLFGIPTSGGVALTHSSSVGPVGSVLNSTSTTVTVGGVPSRQLVGQKIRIISGTGAGQERTITAASDAALLDTVRVTNATTSYATDSTKSWTTNQWRGHTARIILNSGAQQLRRILYNDAITIYWYDTNWSSVEPFYGGVLATNISASTYSIIQIESSLVTVNSPWTVQPDTSSRFMIMSGGLFLCTSNASYFQFAYYDILTDVWYYKSYTAAGGIVSAAWATDMAMTALGADSGVFVSGTASSGTAYSLSDSTKTMLNNRYTGHRIRLTGGTGAGQERVIIDNSPTTLSVSNKFDIVPDNTTTYEVTSEYDKVFLVGNAQSAMLQYSIRADMWSKGRILDFGSCCNMSAYWGGLHRAIAISTITRSYGTGTVTATVTTAINHPFKTGDSITIAGASPVAYNGTFVITVTGSTTFTYTFSAGGDPGAVSAAASQGTTTLVDSSQTWDVNSLVGKICVMTVTAGNGPTYQHRRITANTATTLTFASGTAPLNGTCKYVISDGNGFGSSESRYPLAAQYEGKGISTITRTFGSGKVTATVTTGGNHNLTSGDFITISGASVASYNGTFCITVTAPTTFTYTFFAATDPGAVTITNAYLYNNQMCTSHFFAATSINRSGAGPYTITVTTARDHTFAVGDAVSIWGCTPTAFNGTFTVLTVPTTNSFTYSVTVDPGAGSASAGAISGGSTTTFTDSGKNFVASNVVGKRIRFIAGTCCGQEAQITAATATSLTFGTITGTPDDTSCYCILPNYATGAGLSLVWNLGCSNTNDKGKYLYCFAGGNTNRLNRYNICTDRWEPVHYTPFYETFTTATYYAYDGVDKIYIQVSNSGRILCYDLTTDIMSAYGTIPYSMSTAYVGNRMSIIKSPDDGLAYLYCARTSDTWLWRVLII